MSGRRGASSGSFAVVSTSTRTAWPQRGYAVFERQCGACFRFDVSINHWSIPKTWVTRDDVAHPIYDERVPA